VTAPISKASISSHPANRVVGATAAIAATGALACGVCCVLPFALPAAMLAMSGGVLAWFAGIMPWAIGIALVAVAGGWTWVGAQTVRTRRRPALATLLTMAAATAMLAASLAWPHFEGAVAGLLRQ
jgi:hypothetical protein